MPRDGVILSELPIRLGELVEATRESGTPLGVQGVDRLNTAAVLTPAGEMVCAVHEPALLESHIEFDRLHPGNTTRISGPCYWHDVWVGRDELEERGVRILSALAERVNGHLELAPPIDEYVRAARG